MDTQTQQQLDTVERPLDATSTASLPDHLTCLNCMYSSTEFDHVFCLYYEREEFLPDASLCPEFDFCINN